MQARPEPVQETVPGTIVEEFKREQVIAEINVGLDDLRLNNGQRKEYVMKTLGLRAALPLEKCSNEQLQTIYDQILEDLW